MQAILNNLEEKYNKLSQQISDSSHLSAAQFKDISIELKRLQEIIELKKIHDKLEENLKQALEIISESNDDEMKALAEDELKANEPEKYKIEKNIKRLLLPTDPRDSKGIILEIRAGAGGEEAALFAMEVFKMYSKAAEHNGWKPEILSSHYTGLGGLKEIIFSIEGRNVYKFLKYESGTHRVQRVPITETGGRLHTSTVTVAVLPEADEIELDINEERDLKIDVYRSSGPGGQSVNTTDSAVRITHLPTGLVVTCQDEKSQHKNRAKALKVLRSRLYEQMMLQQQKELSDLRRNQVGTGDRSEKIRTYNFPQNRVTDHRIKLDIFKLNNVLDGHIDEFVNALTEYDIEKKLEIMSKNVNG